MPYKPYKRPRRKKKSSHMAKRVAKLEQQIVPIQKTFEQRQWDYTSAVSAGYEGYALSHATSAAWSMSSLCPTSNSIGGAPPTALDDQIRLGDKITLKTIQIRGEVRGALGTTVAAEASNRVRIMLVRFPEYDAGTSAAVLTSQVLQQYATVTGSYPSNLSSIYSSYKNRIDQYNTADIVKYEVLYDKTCLLNNYEKVEQGAGRQNWRVKFNIKHKFKHGLVCQYGKGLSTEPEINNIVLIMLSDSSGTPHPDTNFVSRFKYMDA